ncbi:MAG: hypothetical protein WHV66_02650 [Anaerolineales bacterium]
MIWLQFIVSSALLVAAAIKLAEYGDVIAIRTKLGGMLIGTLLLAGATSLPEFLTTINSINQNVVDLAAGNLLGSNMFNMFMLAVLDMIFLGQRLLRKAATKHALSGSLATLMIGLVVFFILADIDIRFGWVGLDSLIVMITYIVGVLILQGNKPLQTVEIEGDDLKNLPSLKKALLGFGIATLVLVVVTPWLVRSSSGIAEITGISTGFIGTALLAIITSLPELVTTVSAVRVGAIDLAIGNLFGSNMFNMFAIGAADLFYLDGRFLSAIAPGFVLVGLLGLLLTVFGLIGNLARLERKILFLEIDALVLAISYFVGLWFLYNRGLGF